MNTLKTVAILILLGGFAPIAHGQSYPTVIVLSFATPAMPCSVGAAVLNKTMAICPQNGSITVDIGDGKGYNPWPTVVTGPIGPQGIQGLTGPAGKDGATGPQGIPGATGTFPASACVGSLGPDTKGNTVITFVPCK